MNELLEYFKIRTIKKMHVHDKWKVTGSGRVIEEMYKYTKTQWIKDKSEQEKKVDFQTKLFGIDDSKLFAVPSFLNFMFAWQCIIDINNIDNQLDATITDY